MSTPQQLFQKFLDEQRSEYGRSLPGKVGEIRALWQLAAAGGHEAESLAQLERLAHTLGGTAGTLGFVAAGQAAKALELLVQQAMQDAAEWTAMHPHIERAIGCLQDSLPHADPASTDAPAQMPGSATDAG